MPEDNLYDLGLKYFQIDTAGITVLSEGPGELVAIVISNDAATDVLILYDDVVTSSIDRRIALITASAGESGTYTYKLPVASGLTLDAAVVAGSTVIIYR